MLEAAPKGAAILPLMGDLDFIQNKKAGAIHSGHFEINQHDFDLISSHMLPSNYA